MGLVSELPTTVTLDNHGGPAGQNKNYFVKINIKMSLDFQNYEC